MNSCSFGVIRALPSQLGISCFLNASTKSLAASQIFHVLSSQHQETHYGQLLFKQIYSTHSQALMQMANALSLPAKSLRCERPPIKLPPSLNNSMGRMLLKCLGFYSHKSQLLHGGQDLYKAIKEQCDDGVLIKAFDLDPEVFFSTFTLLSLHVWLVVHRLGHRNDADIKDFKQRFYALFQHDVERRVHHAGVQVGVGKWLRKLESVFYSSGIALDKTFSQVRTKYYEVQGGIMLYTRQMVVAGALW
ncbi:hypothetical protein CEUSTIGMA_g13896.t1 [Chlamydomonas eustigma]|uniref:Ubiquinol-cytochrome c chaperone domain-containing protein n=1 Tax=Chlamydomonas eustigma TaxID=1157962 RepID=A0A250XTU4_9CHLO|nr:hypothetical protein CEUSTIGMA_g13896.t1 [Chlamydomonas eustigma]|eukprot:GAX86487.1 hypothetical protein CEUSTIGMA_g13896.t1 [Chlamydomonas eustigma]